MHTDIASVCKCLKHNEQLPPSVHLLFPGQLLKANTQLEEMRGVLPD